MTHLLVPCFAVRLLFIYGQLDRTFLGKVPFKGLLAIRYVIFILLLILGLPLYANEAIKRDFADWADQHEISPYVLVALDANGSEIVRTGSLDPLKTAMPIASISKTIAGQCAVYMVREELLSFENTISDFLDWPSVQGGVTVAQLLTHTGGIGPDATQNDIKGQNLTEIDRVRDLIDEISTRPLLTSNDAQYAYNNENYLILEAVMTEALGEDAVTWCARSVPQLRRLQSLGRAPQAHALGLAGGLEISADDLVRFFHDLDLADDWPSFALDRRSSYGPGIIVQNTSAGTNLFHVGGICLLTGPNFGAFAVRLTNGNSVSILYSGCADDTSLQQLNALILKHFAAG